MREQITQKMLDLRLEWLNKALGRPLANWTKDAQGKCKANIGNIHLEKAMGGWTIEENISDGGAITQPFGRSRHTKSEIIDIIDAALAGIEMARKIAVPNTVCVTFADAEEAKLFADKIKMAMEKPEQQLSGVHLGILRDRAAKAVEVKII